MLTSRFGIAGTLLGLALGAMILTAVADFLKVYLARTSHAAHTAAIKVPGAIKAPRGFLAGRLFRRKGRDRPKAPYRGFSSPAGGRWRRWSLVAGKSVVAAAISFLLGVGAVTAIEHSAGKSLSCWVWEECPVQTSADEDDGSSDTSTQPSIFGGGSSAGSSAAAPGVQPASFQQQRATPASGTPESPSSQTRSKAAGSVGSAGGAGDGWQNRSEQQQDSYYSEEYEQQTTSSRSTEEAEDGGSAGWEKQTTGEYDVSSVPWST